MNAPASILFGPRRRVVALVAILLLPGVALVGCDSLSGPSTRSGGQEGLQRAHSEGTVRLTHMSPDDLLLQPGLGSGIARKTGKDKGNQSSEGASPYGCVFSTPNIEGDSLYRYEAAYVSFPEGVVKKAGTETRPVHYKMSSRTAYVDEPRSVAHVLRHARCRIPDSDRAMRLLQKRLQEFPKPSETDAGTDRGGKNGEHSKSSGSPAVWRGVAVPEASGCIATGSVPLSKVERECVEYTQVCYPDETCWHPPDEVGIVCPECETVCTRYRLVQEEEEERNGGGGTGDEPDECNYDGGVADQLCGGSGTTDPPVTDTTSFPCVLSASELMPEESWLALGSANPDSAKKFVNFVMAYGKQFGLDNQTEVKHFLAQVAHESESQILTTEDAVNLSREEARVQGNVRSDEPKRNGDAIYNLDRVMNSEKLQFSIEYGDRMGNGGLSTRDGWTYRGRGAIQLTGENNYEAFNTFYESFAQKQGWSHPNLVENPGHVASNVRIATMAALHFWKNNVDGKLDSNPTVKEVTELINGGKNGLSDRKTEFDAIKENVNCSK